MKQICLLALLLFGLSAALQAQPQCTVLSIDRLGGIGMDAIARIPGAITYPDGTFSLTLASDPDPGIIICTPTFYYFQCYDANYNNILDTVCAPIGTNFSYASFFVYPQSNGDTILIGQSDDNSGDYGMERRDASGNVLWTKSYGGTGYDALTTVIMAPDSCFFLGGMRFPMTGT